MAAQRAILVMIVAAAVSVTIAVLASISVAQHVAGIVYFISIQMQVMMLFVAQDYLQAEPVQDLGKHFAVAQQDVFVVQVAAQDMELSQVAAQELVIGHIRILLGITIAVTASVHLFATTDIKDILGVSTALQAPRAAAAHVSDKHNAVAGLAKTAHEGCGRAATVVLVALINKKVMHGFLNGDIKQAARILLVQCGAKVHSSLDVLCQGLLGTIGGTSTICVVQEAQELLAVVEQIVPTVEVISMVFVQEILVKAQAQAELLMYVAIQ